MKLFLTKMLENRSFTLFTTSKIYWDECIVLLLVSPLTICTKCMGSLCALSVCRRRRRSLFHLFESQMSIMSAAGLFSLFISIRLFSFVFHFLVSHFILLSFMRSFFFSCSSLFSLSCQTHEKRWNRLVLFSSWQIIYHKSKTVSAAYSKRKKKNTKRNEWRDHSRRERERANGKKRRKTRRQSERESKSEMSHICNDFLAFIFLLLTTSCTHWKLIEVKKKRAQKEKKMLKMTNARVSKTWKWNENYGDDDEEWENVTAASIIKTDNK